eukprot:TRINITY_DN4435_c0_g1_i1.p1 TRINITY_DN4435_c0_g1~~TRINITY_DN4435_c0_g1_i1.p1  ORF type:complete len:848 (-),score=193.37 TRINITY_DN4435_c0_g1_i1:191-2608(-)
MSEHGQGSVTPTVGHHANSNFASEVRRSSGSWTPGANASTSASLLTERTSSSSRASPAISTRARPPPWIPDEMVKACSNCRGEFWFFSRKHHCRNCGRIFCGGCCDNLANLPHFGFQEPVRVCGECFKKIKSSEGRLRSSSGIQSSEFENKVEIMKGAFGDAVDQLSSLEDPQNDEQLQQRNREITKICKLTAEKLSGAVPLEYLDQLEQQRTSSVIIDHVQLIESLKKREQEHQEIRTFLKQLESQLNQKEQVLKQKEETLRKKENILKQEESDLNFRATEIKEQEFKNQEKERQLEERERELKKREESSSAKENSLAYSAGLQERHKELQEREQNLEEREKEVDEREYRIKKREIKMEDLEEREATLNEREKHLSEREAELKICEERHQESENQSTREAEFDDQPSRFHEDEPRDVGLSLNTSEKEALDQLLFLDNLATKSSSKPPSVDSAKNALKDLLAFGEETSPKNNLETSTNTLSLLNLGGSQPQSKTKTNNGLNTSSNAIGNSFFSYDELFKKSVVSEKKTLRELDPFSLVSDFAVFADINKAGLKRAKKKKMQMEDEYIADCPFNNDNNRALFGVLDGHIDKNCASDAKVFFPQELIKELSGRLPSSSESMKHIFSIVDKKLIAHEYEGTTATICYIWREADATSSSQLSRYLQVANVGDSAAFLCRRGTAVPLTKDHRVTDPEERARLKDSGVEVTDDMTRLNGLNICRTLGDHFTKENDVGIISEPYVSDIITIQEEDSHIIIASDGLWDVMDGQTACEIVLKERTAEGMSRSLVQSALKFAECKDNITVIVIAL